jgi:hypothetical protein
MVLSDIPIHVWFWPNLVVQWQIGKYLHQKTGILDGLPGLQDDWQLRYGCKNVAWGAQFVLSMPGRSVREAVTERQC